MVQHDISLDGLSVCLGIPAGRDINPLTVRSIVATQELCLKLGIPFQMILIANNAIVQWARDEVVDLFLNGNANRLFMVDSDMIWGANDFIRMLALSTVNEVICATYPAKKEPTTYFLYRDDKEPITTDEYGLIDIWGVGLGFTVVSREILEKLYEKAPKIYDDIAQKEVAQIFRVGYTEEGKRQGEDMAFFEDVRSLGYKVKLDPTINLGHHGNKVFKGDITGLLGVSNEVTILGLYSVGVVPDDIKGQVWSMNDWFVVYPWLCKLDRVYQIHGYNVMSAKPRWDIHLEHYKSTKAKIVVNDKKYLEEFDADIIDYDNLKKKHPLDYVCTVDIMIAEAIEAGFTKINLVGVCMMDEDHRPFIKGILKAVDYARSLGIEINAPHEREWREYNGEATTEEYILKHRDK